MKEATARFGGIIVFILMILEQTVDMKVDEEEKVLSGATDEEPSSS